MKAVFLGTGAAEGIPALFCNCEYCTAVRRRGGKEIRTRAQLLLDGELSVEFPPDVFAHGISSGIDLSAIKYLLVTHSHFDHFSPAQLILRGYKFAHGMTSPTLDIFANEEACGEFSEATRLEMKDCVKNTVSLHPIGAMQTFSCGDWTVHTLPARHSSKEPLVFLIEKGEKRVLYLTDTGALPDMAWEGLSSFKGKILSLVVLDCTFLFGETAKEARHMGLDENARTMEKLRNLSLTDERTKFVITHFSHNSKPSPDLLAKAEREYGVIAAYDGMTLEV